MACDGTLIKVRQWNSATGQWKITKQGENYFKHRRVEWVVHLPIILVRKRDNGVFGEDMFPVAEIQQEAGERQLNVPILPRLTNLQRLLSEDQQRQFMVEAV